MKKVLIVTNGLSYLFNKHKYTSNHSRRINTEEKAKLVDFIGGGGRIYSIHHILQNRPKYRQNSVHGQEFNQFCHPNISDDLCLFFCIQPSSTFCYFQPEASLIVEDFTISVCSSSCNFIFLAPLCSFSILLSSPRQDWVAPN